MDVNLQFMAIPVSVLARYQQPTFPWADREVVNRLGIMMMTCVSNRTAYQNGMSLSAWPKPPPLSDWPEAPANDDNRGPSKENHGPRSVETAARSNNGSASLSRGRHR